MHGAVGPRDPPAIVPDHLAIANDRRVAVDSIRLTRRIMLESAPFAPRRLEEYRPGSDARDDSQLLEAATHRGTTIVHPVGTCRVGQDRMAVVCDRLRVRGLERLRVVDASVMPTIASGNANAPTIMIAEKASAMIREGRR